MSEKRQVVLIMTDTTRKDMVGCYNPGMITPNIDRLAEEGIRYENAYTCQPVCGPARSALFTGTFPHTNGMVTNCVSLRKDAKTVGEWLSEQGVHCGYIGKWHLDGGDYFGYGICPEGYDPEYWYDMKCYLDELTPEERVKSRQSETSFAEDMTEEFTYAHRCTNRAIDFVEKYKDETFFLTLSYDEPHGPSLCPAPFNTMYADYKFDDNPNYEDDLSKKPLMQRLWSGADINKTAEELNRPSKARALFLGCNSFVDYEIGRVMEVINREIPDALVIFTSDHGDMLGNHRLQMKNASAYKEIANIPLIIRGGESGKVVTEPASHIDMAPTVMDYLGVKIPITMEGKSMLPQIRNVSEKINDHVFLEFTRYEVDHDGFGGLQMMRAVVSEKYKLVIHLLDSDELYDLEKDPYEICNLINDEAYAQIRNELHDLLVEHMNQTRDPYRGYQWEVRSWRTDLAVRWENAGYTRQRENNPGEPRQLDYDTGLEMETAVRRKTTNDVKA